MFSFLDRLLRWSFFALFLLVPLVFFSDTSELFEFNKMWITFGLTIIIVGAWVGKSIVEKQFRLQRTPLDIPILLFLLSQLVSTIFSIDPRISWWGYYSRFNGGFLSLFSYVLLYYAFVSNVTKKQIASYVSAILLGGAAVALWGLPSHFGYDPTCFVFRGTLDVSCWTFAFQPKVRIFSTLGQPDWLAAYLVALIPLAIHATLHFWKEKRKLWAGIFFLTTILFYVDLIYTRAKSGFVGLGFALLTLIGMVVWTHRATLKSFFKQQVAFVGILASLLVITFFIGSPFDQIDRFTFIGLRQALTPKVSQQAAPTSDSKPTTPAQPAGEFGGTDSGKIRLYVWEGAIKAWLSHPIIGTGVETFAFAYYQNRPAAHNLTSEWDYLYNKAHNEYLNYLATTGAFGLGTYLVMIVFFLFLAKKRWYKDSKEEDVSQDRQYLVAALLAAYVGTLVTNFFGFSVVIMNIFLFLIPGFVFLVQDVLTTKKMVLFPKNASESISVSGFQWVGLSGVGLVSLYFLSVLFNMWSSDKLYALGYNLDHAGEYQTAYTPLHQAVQQDQAEPVFQDELSINDAVLAAALAQQNNATTAAQLAEEAVGVSSSLVASHPNNVTFWKSRVRILYMLAPQNPNYYAEALTAIQKAASLAPTDAKIAYNLGLIYGQSGHLSEAITALEKTVQLKPDYKDAYYALGLFYHSLAVDSSGRIVDAAKQQKAVDEMHYILDHFSKDDQQANQALKAWGAE